MAIRNILRIFGIILLPFGTLLSGFGIMYQKNLATLASGNPDREKK
jgi:hypothetical protein